MAATINWIHLTDLHVGLDDHSWLWPVVKHDLLRDLEKLADQIEGWDGWDLVLVTGDLTQKGDTVEFERFNREIDDLWNVLSKRGRTPALCVVPGNHDLTRPASNSAIAKTLTQLWWEDPEVREHFWRDAKCEYRIAIDDFFDHYRKWVSSVRVPMLNVTPGLLPGDFSATLEKGALTLGVVGLNSTFLHLAPGDFKGKLDLHVSQLNLACGGDPVRWIRERTASVLLTHHPPSWLEARALDHFRQEIYPPGRFVAQFCGHLHEPEAFEQSEAGAAPRRLRQGVSVFGLANWQGAEPTKRHHGYAAGQFLFQGPDGVEKLWPRTAVKGLHGGLNLCPDHRYKLRDGDCTVTNFDLDGDGGEALHEDHEDVAEQRPSRQPVQGDATSKPDLQLLEQPPDEQTSRVHLAACPRLSLRTGPQHRLVRQEEQSQVEHELRKARCIWIVADWGTGQEGFLAATIERFRTQGSHIDVFQLCCEDAADVDAFEALFPQQFGIPLQSFCGYASSLKESFLVLDGVHPALCAGDNVLRLRRIASAIVDYCPNLRLVLTSRVRPSADVFPVAEVRALEVPDVRTYVMNHPDATPELWEPDIVEKLHECSDGLPMHLDHMLRELKVSSLASVLEAYLEGPLTADGTTDTTPKALVDTVSILSRSQDKRSKRSFRLLKVLSVLPYGETLEALRHYLPTEPFFAENALQLSELALLDVVPLQHSATHVGMMERSGVFEQRGPKILKVPRQVRDHIHTLLTEDERAEIILAGAEKFFGRDWRKGKVKLRAQPLEYREYLSSGAGNEFALIHHLIVDAGNKGDGALLRRATKLGVYYAEHLKSADRYRDVTLVVGPLVQQVDRHKCPEEWCQLSALLGEGLRMTSKHQEALRFLKEALEVGETHLTPDDKASVWLHIALCEQSLSNTDTAIEAAGEVKRHAKPDSGTYLHAVSIIADLTLQGEDKLRELTRLERQARDKGYTGLAATISLQLATVTKRAAEKVELLDRVLAGKTQGYNQARAAVAKARISQESGEALVLTPMDLVSLARAYSYLHAQRLGVLFDRCHEALWQVFEATGDVSRLLRLFRHASFVWRIRGDDAKEAEYLKRLSERNVPPAEGSFSSIVVVEVRYFWKRLKVLIVGAPNVEAEVGR